MIRIGIQDVHQRIPIFQSQWSRAKWLLSNSRQASWPMPIVQWWVQSIEQMRTQITYYWIPGKHWLPGEQQRRRQEDGSALLIKIGRLIGMGCALIYDTLRFFLPDQKWCRDFDRKGCLVPKTTTDERRSESCKAVTVGHFKELPGGTRRATGYIPFSRTT